MIANTLTLVLRQHWPLAIVFAIISYLAHNYFNRGLNKYPGPIICALTDWYRFFKAWQRTPERWHIDLHEKHGDIVRLGPNCLSFGNPKSIKVIYALGKGFTKVFAYDALIDCSQCSQQLVRLLSRTNGYFKGRKATTDIVQHSVRGISLATEAQREQRFYHVRSNAI